MIRSGRRRSLFTLLAVAAAGLLWCAWRWWEVGKDRKAMAEIEEQIENGRHGTASRNLTDFLARHPGSDEALYLLGVCEAALGRPGPADRAWTRIPLDSSFAPRAIFGRMQLEMEGGRFAAAEKIIKDALDDPRIDAASLPILLGPLFCYQVRLVETLRLIESRWDHLDDTGEGASEAALNLARSYIDLREKPVPDEVIRSVLDQASSLAPDDDRVWLGKANLAIRSGAYEEAARWTDACLRKRPDDVPAWRARLDWAIATGHVPQATEALEHLSAAEEPPDRPPRLAAWIAARRGEPEAERRALERLVAIAPEDFAAVDRLAELSARQGRTARAAELARQKAEIERLRARYLQLYRRNQPGRDAAEMSRLAERLGRRFEARAFATIGAAAAPDNEELRRRLASLDRVAMTADRKGPTLADALAVELDALGLSAATALHGVPGGPAIAPTSAAGQPDRPGRDSDRR